MGLLTRALSVMESTQTSRQPHTICFNAQGPARMVISFLAIPAARKTVRSMAHWPGGCHPLLHRYTMSPTWMLQRQGVHRKFAGATEGMILLYRPAAECQDPAASCANMCFMALSPVVSTCCPCQASVLLLWGSDRPCGDRLFRHGVTGCSGMQLHQRLEPKSQAAAASTPPRADRAGQQPPGEPLPSDDGRAEQLASALALVESLTRQAPSPDLIWMHPAHIAGCQLWQRAPQHARAHH